MLASSWAFSPLLSCTYCTIILYTHLYTRMHTCTHTAHIHLDSDEGQRSSLVCLCWLWGSPAAHMVATGPPPSRVPSRHRPSVGATAHRSCHLGVRSDCSGSERMRMAWRQHVVRPVKVGEDPAGSALWPLGGCPGPSEEGPALTAEEEPGWWPLSGCLPAPRGQHSPAQVQAALMELHTHACMLPVGAPAGSPRIERTLHLCA